jgi:hypothetical protein
VAPGLEAEERRAEGLALRRVVEAELDQPLHDADREGGDHEPLAPEVGEHVAHAAPLLADPVRDRDAALVEEELARVRGARAELVEPAPDREARGRRGKEDERDAAGAGAPRAHGERHEVGARPVRDVGLLARDHVLLALAARARRERGDVGASGRLRDADRADPLAADRGGEPGLLELVAGQVGQGREGELRVREQGDRRSHGVALRELLAEHAGGEVVEAAAAPARRVANAEEAGLARLAVELARDLPRRLPLARVGPDLPGGEGRDGLAEGLVLFGQVDRGRAGIGHSGPGGLLVAFD